MHKISIEQWRMFVAVVDYGGFAQAGDAMYKTQSTVSHSIKKLESTLGKAVFEVVGRKANLTGFGESLLVAARALVSQADALEHDAISQKSTIKSTFSIAADVLVPRQMLFALIKQLTQAFPDINVQLYQTCLSRTAELLTDGTVDVGIASVIPKGFISEMAMAVDLQVVTHKDNPLLALSNVSLEQLSEQRQIVLRDAGLRHNVNSGWLGTQTRFTVSNFEEALYALAQNIGFAWLPDWLIEEASSRFAIQKVDIKHGQVRTVALQLGFHSSLAKQPELALFREALLEVSLTK